MANYQRKRIGMLELAIIVTIIALVFIGRRRSHIQRRIQYRSPGATIEYRPIPQATKDAVWRRAQGRCEICRSKYRLEFDHMVPRSEGGTNGYNNIQLICHSCHYDKTSIEKSSSNSA